MKLRAVLVFASLAALASSASAQDFNIDCLRIFGNPSNAYGAAAGQAGFWTNIDCFGGLPPQALLDTSGGATAATLDHSSGFNFAADNAATLGDDQALLDDAQCGFGNPVWTIAGLAAGNYHVYCYAWAPDVPTSYITNCEVVGGSAGVQPCGGAAWTGAHVDGVTYVDDVVMGVGAGGTITVNFTVGSGFATMNGMQLDLMAAGPPPPTPYCTSGTTTNGCLASITATANPSVSFANACSINVANVEGQKSGILFYGINGPAAINWNGSSVLCVKAPTQRTGTQSSGGTANLCNGTLTLNWNTYQMANPGSLGNPFASGNVVNAQGWFRDPPAGKTTNLSNGVQMTLVP